MAISEKQLLTDILEAFMLPRVAVHDLMDYEKDLIYDAFPRYDKKYLQNLLDRADKKGYSGISDKVLAPEPKYLTRPTEYVIKYKPKRKAGDYRIEKNKNKD